MELFSEPAYLNSVHKRLNAKISKFTEDSCWNWQGGKNSKGYGRLTVKLASGKYKAFSVSRLVWLFYNRLTKFPSEKIICHTCDNPSCMQKLIASFLCFLLGCDYRMVKLVPREWCTLYRQKCRRCNAPKLLRVRNGR